MSGSNDELEPLGRDELARAGHTLALAMAADPFYRYMLPDDARRLRWMGPFITALLRMLHPDGHVYGLGEGRTEGVIGLSPPGAQPLPLGRNLRFALRAMFRRPSRRPPLRRLVHGARVMKRVDALHPHEPHWYLCILGVHPDAQGRGLGKRLLAPLLAWADRDGVPCYLETTNERNLAYYQRLGFELRDTIEDPGGAPPVRTMMRG